MGWCWLYKPLNIWVNSKGTARWEVLECAVVPTIIAADNNVSFMCGWTDPWLAAAVTIGATARPRTPAVHLHDMYPFFYRLSQLEFRFDLYHIIHLFWIEVRACPANVENSITSPPLQRAARIREANHPALPICILLSLSGKLFKWQCSLKEAVLDVWLPELELNRGRCKDLTAVWCTYSLI